MEPNIESNTTEKIETPAIKPEKPKGLIATTIILAILAIGGIATAIYFYLNASSEAANNSELQAKIKLLESETGSKLVEKNENNTKTTVVEQSTSPLSVAEATKLLEEKYDFHSEESTLCHGGRIVCALDNFDKDKKIEFVILHAPDELFTNRREESSSYVLNIKYDDLSSLYNKYFGSKERIDKEDHDFEKHSALGKMNYLPESDSFDIEFRTGFGGLSPVYLFSKVVETNKTQDGFSATMTSVLLNQAPISEEYLEQHLKEVKESLSVYKFNFVEEDGDYKLVSIKKVEQ